MPLTSSLVAPFEKRYFSGGHSTSASSLWTVDVRVSNLNTSGNPLAAELQPTSSTQCDVSIHMHTNSEHPVGVTASTMASATGSASTSAAISTSQYN